MAFVSVTLCVERIKFIIQILLPVRGKIQSQSSLARGFSGRAITLLDKSAALQHICARFAGEKTAKNRRRCQCDRKCHF